MRKILVIGEGGQVSSNLADLLQGNKNFEFLAVGYPDIDLSNPQEVYPKLKALNFKPDVIINAAAYTAVDLAETEREKCNNINNIAVGEIAKYATKTQALLIHYSTDYVYNGTGDKEFEEDDIASLVPLNYYGQTKLDGEKQIVKSGCNYFILRTSWVYNHSGKNFVLTMLKLAAEKDELKIISDQIGSPTYAYDIANITLQMILGYKNQSGVYHFVSPEKISWYQFTNLIIEQARGLGFPIKVKNIVPITTAEYPTAAKRPLNSRLSMSKLQSDFGLKFPQIGDSLASCLNKVR